jgi:hypothetical protein
MSLIQKSTSVVAASFCLGCAFVGFEPAPYSPRQLEVVYSEQEDLTFLSWKLAREADPGSVSFELFDGAQRRPITLDQAPFPAEPYECGNAICFQYQLPGLFEPPDAPLIHSIHARFGEHASPRATLSEVTETFSIDPIAIDRNRRADVRRYDWFADNEIPLVRAYDWRFVDGACGAEGPAFAPLDGAVDLPEGWAGDPACIEVSPRRRDRQGAIASAPLVASAETQLLARQRYDAPSAVHTTLYGVLFDLAIADAARCSEVRTALSSRIDAAITRRDPDAVKLGEYEPEGAQNCDPAPPEGYPIARMLADAQDAVLDTAGPHKTIFWIYVGNRAGSARDLASSWEELLGMSAALDRSPVYAWVIASNERAFEISARWLTPYRPVEDPTLLDDIDSVSELALPFRTLEHDLETQVELTAPAPRPEYARICQSVPIVASVEIDGAMVDPLAFAWPRRDLPLYTVDLGAQIGVPNAEFVAQSSEVQLEVCTAFCEGPFRTQAGIDHESWLASDTCAGFE